MTAIDPTDYRHALGSFVTGVTIVTARDPSGEPVGLTVNSFNSVSLDPPLVLWSLALRSQSLPSFREAKSWAVHVLAAGQEELSGRFATPGADKFGGIDLVDGPEGAPEIPGVATRFGCESTFEYEGGDHAIFVGHVRHLKRSEVEPLIYHGGRYARVATGMVEGKEELELTAVGRSLITDLATRLESGASLSDADRALVERLTKASI